MNVPPFLTAENLNHPAVTHGFFTAKGGVSHGIYESLNCGPGSHDDAAAVRQNRLLVQQALGGDALMSLYQIHSPDVVVVRAPWAGENPKGDAMVTREKGILLGILTADCVPVLLADAGNGVAAAAHAGWKGAVGGVLEETVAMMLKQGAALRQIQAAIGPCIHQPSYEVGADVRAAVTLVNMEDRRFFKPNMAGKYQFDLPGYVAARLERAGVLSIAASSLDTYKEANGCFSYRRNCHRAVHDYGRQISAIGLR